MDLHALLAEVHPHWFDRHAGEDDAVRSAAPAIPQALLARGRESRLGRRLLARWLAAGPAPVLLAPSLDRQRLPPRRWPPPRLARLVRDLGTLAFAPAVRAEVRREPVRRIKRMLGNGYLLALDRTIWDGRVGAAVASRLREQLDAALTDADEVALPATLDRQGRGELLAWSAAHDRALGEWLRLLHPPEARARHHLPDAAVQLLHDHHLTADAEEAARP